MGALGARFWRKKRKTRGRKGYRKRYRRRLGGVRNGISFLPKNRVVKLRYSEQYTLTSSVGALSTQVFRANGAYDPDYTNAGGHQPLGWDNVCSAFYQHYCVLGARITVRTLAQTDNDAYSGVIGLYVADTNAPSFTSYTNYIESRRGGWRLVNGGTNRSQTLSANFSAKRFFNVTDMKDNYDRLGATTSADPSEQAYFVLFYQSTDEVNTASNVSCVVTIDYILALSEPKDIAEN